MSEENQDGFFDVVRRKIADGSMNMLDFGYIDADGWHPPQFTITTLSEAKELLKSYSPEEVRQLWESGAFTKPIPPDVKAYFIDRILNGPEND